MTELRPSPRMLEILALLAQGLTREEVCKRIYISDGTIKIHLAETYQRLGARNTTHAVALALSQGLIELSGGKASEA